ncbi:hypothetical protein GCK72_026076 [Caenorhabditis remanei]|uniref:Uncharacterized protein n=1 Tax=Caenorhabditis remanei TaxID=31234 RepID=A0A6A5G3P0_CAERE|nr:hypothetical protein GCK72_026076 [Caenorhabditis remanei]KAF1749608.1 hypothetical protein GCK72_026076 [Caenorhabditis remanei]
MSSGVVTIGAKRSIGNSLSPSSPKRLNLIEMMQVNIPEVAQPYRDSNFILTPPYSVIGDLHFSIDVPRLPDRVPAPPPIPAADIAFNGVHYAPPPPPIFNQPNMIPTKKYLEMMKLLIISLGSPTFTGVLARIEGNLQVVPACLMCQEWKITDSLKCILYMIRNQSYLPPFPVQGSLTAKNIKIALHALSFMLESPDMNKFRADLQKEIDVDIGLHKINPKKLNAAFHYAIESIVI